MNVDPLQVALREITETKRLLEQVITCSESFDYARAKTTLGELQLKIKRLGRIQADLMDCGPAGPDRIIPFPGVQDWASSSRD